MGIAGSRDDLIAFLNANSSKEWRSQKGDRRNLWSAKDENGWNKYYIGWDSLSMHVNANPRKCQKVVQPPGLTTNQQQWLEAWQHLRTHTLAKPQHTFAIILWVPLLTHMRGISVVPFGHAWKRSWYWWVFVLWFAFHSVNQGIQLWGKGKALNVLPGDLSAYSMKDYQWICWKGCWKVWKKTHTFQVKDDSKQSEMNRHLIPTFKKIWHTLYGFSWDEV